MKKIILLLGMFLACTACEKDLDTYEGGNGIYFDTENMSSDTLEIHWGLKNTEVKGQEIKLKVCLFGNATPYDRKFGVEVFSETNDFGAKEGIDYEALGKEYILPAHQVEMNIPLHLKRRDGLELQAKRFTVKLVENTELGFLYSREEKTLSEKGEVTATRPIDYQRVIYMDESFPMPFWWYEYGDEIFGTYSLHKAKLICDVLGIDREQWIGWDETGVPVGLLRYYGKKMHNWLQENPQFEEDGSEMEMGWGTIYL